MQRKEVWGDWGVNAIVIEGWDIHFWLKGANNRPHFLILTRKMGMKSYSSNWLQTSNANTIIPVSCFEVYGYLVALKLCKTSISVPAGSSVLLMVTFHCKDFWCVLSGTVNWKDWNETLWACLICLLVSDIFPYFSKVHMFSLHQAGTGDETWLCLKLIWVIQKLM